MIKKSSIGHIYSFAPFTDRQEFFLILDDKTIFAFKKIDAACDNVEETVLELLDDAILIK